jgi:mannose-1-phosphate guanylyltransferase / mannose-6-phosphate isomerase
MLVSQHFQAAFGRLNMATSHTIIPVILSGGTGSRLWPVSREAAPKPFIKMTDGKSLLQKTMQRAAAIPGVKTVITVTNKEYHAKTAQEYAELGSTPESMFVLEPFGRNTAAAIALAAHAAKQIAGNEDATLVVLAADHLIQDTAGFVTDALAAQQLAASSHLVTFGIRPTHPETGYGYIEQGAAKGEHGFAVNRFVEKPYLELAQKYLIDGNYLWNSGMFAFRISDFFAALEKAEPELAQQAAASWAISHAAAKNKDVVTLEEESFKAVKNISIDYAVMERASNVAMVPARFDWSDIGSWNAMQKLDTIDENGNATHGEVVIVDSHNCYVRANDRLVAAVGLDNLVVVDTPDAILVAHADRTQDVKQVVDKLKETKNDIYRFHKTVSRPWGTYTVIEEGSGFKVKRIEVRPGSSLSLQMHHHRAEHWIVVQGTATVTNGEQVMLLRQNESTYIPAGQKHRLENPGKIDLVLIEVQTGNYLGEDDIVRFQDIYGRA